ncbi:hypothetical protein NKJ66_01110 [Mesorhizobium sp. M0078]|uniref:hypothetical protein n=1 Tax=Mesorhizobium sp. M0078 TaxID=2956871 RepID=UPI003335FAE0
MIEKLYADHAKAVEAAAIWKDEQIQALIDKTAAETWASMGLVPVGWHRCTLDAFPVEHEHVRDAWTIRKGKVVVDMPRAKEATRHRLRAERSPLMLVNDREALRALEIGDQVALEAITAEKQRLRDITKLPAIDAAETPDDLKALSCDIAQP